MVSADAHAPEPQGWAVSALFARADAIPIGLLTWSEFGLR